MSLRLLPLCVLVACSDGPTATLPDLPGATGAATPLAIVGVSVIPMDTDRVLPNQTVIVRGGVIASIAPTGHFPLPADAVVIAGAGRYLMPGLTDMHVHLRRGEATAYVRHGITTVRNMWGYSTLAALSADIASAAVIGPTVHSASPGVDGDPPQWPETVLVTATSQVESSVAPLASQGYRWLKVYSRLQPAVFDSVMITARAFGMLPIGHVPLSVDLRTALDAGMHSIEHFTGYDRAVSATGRSGTSGWADAVATRFLEYAQLSVAAGVWNCPTLAIYAHLAEQQHSPAERDAIVANRRAFVKALHDAGARLLVGSDAGIDVVAPGVSLHDELAEFVRAGLTPYEALRLATVRAAEFLGREKLGSIAPGMDAELLLVNGNPLAEIASARSIAGIILRGAWIPARSLP
ncbi:MAG TPA: amidohydrolase family protein [Gemmatimonadaceae bacterium]|nr:amidohydrolase family protein [Gemmatimonadaceae bacterium]